MRKVWPLVEEQVERMRHRLSDIECAIQARNARLALLALEELRAECYRLYIILQQISSLQAQVA